jgi:hypothetical protein
MFLESLVFMWIIFGYIYYLQNNTPEESFDSESESSIDIEANF